MVQIRSLFRIHIASVENPWTSGIDRPPKIKRTSPLSSKMPAVSIRRARHWACGAGASMRSLYVPASRECSRTRGSQKPAGIGRTRCPTSSSLVQQATRRDPLSWRWRVERACATCSTQLGTIHVGCLHGGAASSRSHRANLRCDDLRPCASR